MRAKGGMREVGKGVVLCIHMNYMMFFPTVKACSSYQAASRFLICALHCSVRLYSYGGFGMYVNIILKRLSSTACRTSVQQKHRSSTSSVAHVLSATFIAQL